MQGQQASAAAVAGGGAASSRVVASIQRSSRHCQQPVLAGSFAAPTVALPGHVSRATAVRAVAEYNTAVAEATEQKELVSFAVLAGCRL